MNAPELNIVILGLSITSSWGNGHATTYRGLVRELEARGHRVLFLERDKPWYADNRDLPEPPYCQTVIYSDLQELRTKYADAVAAADLVIVGSYVPDGVEVGKWVQATARGIRAFYDIDTPVTLAKLRRRDYEYLSPELIPEYDLYLSFTGGPTLEFLEQRYGAPATRALYCSVDPELYYPEKTELKYDLGYLGTYSKDRQPALQVCLLQAAKKWSPGRFVVAGPQFPEKLVWPENVAYITHLPPAAHRSFYNSQRFTLNITRRDMRQAGYSPSVRLFEAAACGVPIISDSWPGLESFFRPDEEILISNSPEDTLRYLQQLAEKERQQISARARQKVLENHTAAHRAAQLEGYVLDLLNSVYQEVPLKAKAAKSLLAEVQKQEKIIL